MQQRLFLGYVRLDGKKCAQKLRDGNFMTWEGASMYESVGGVLAPETVLIDIDDDEQAQLFYSIVTGEHIACRVVKTSRGRHFYFTGYPAGLTCKTHARLACGIDADIKVGSRLTYGVVKLNGQVRPVERDPEVCDALPVWARPVTWTPDFTHMGEGDGRNQVLFNYILTLQSSGFSRDECRSTLTVINNYLFDEPMPARELMSVYRDEAFSDELFYEKGHFLFDKFAQYMRSEHSICRINNQLHIFTGAVYSPSTRDIESAMIKHLPRLSRANRAEVIDYLDVSIRDNTPCADANFVAFNNCVLDLSSRMTMPLDSGFVLTNMIKWDYTPGVYSAIADNTLTRLANGDSDTRLLLEEIIGYTFYRRNELRKSFILLGDKANGKSTYLDMIKTLLGDENIAALDMADLNSRFKTAELFGKLANIGDDISDDFIPDVSVFKKLVSGDRVSAERKGKDPFEFNSYAKLLFSANTLPRVRDRTGAVMDRLVIVPFTATFSQHSPDFDPYIKYKLRTPEVMSYMIDIGLAGLDRVLTAQRFTLPDASRRAIDDFRADANPVVEFFAAYERDDLVGKTVSQVYDNYIAWAIRNSCTPLGQLSLTRMLCKHFDLTTKSARVRGERIKLLVPIAGLE